jgi:hypothetical protein
MMSSRCLRHPNKEHRVSPSHTQPTTFSEGFPTSPELTRWCLRHPSRFPGAFGTQPNQGTSCDKHPARPCNTLPKVLHGLPNHSQPLNFSLQLWYQPFTAFTSALFSPEKTLRVTAAFTQSGDARSRSVGDDASCDKHLLRCAMHRLWCEKHPNQGFPSGAFGTQHAYDTGGSQGSWSFGPQGTEGTYGAKGTQRVPCFNPKARHMGDVTGLPSECRPSSFGTLHSSHPRCDPKCIR